MSEAVMVISTEAFKTGDGRVFLSLTEAHEWEEKLAYAKQKEAAKQAQKFWMVWCEDGGHPTVKHYTQEVAEREAERLSQNHRGQRFFVMAPIRSVVSGTVVWEDTSDRPECDVPF